MGLMGIYKTGETEGSGTPGKFGHFEPKRQFHFSFEIINIGTGLTTVMDSNAVKSLTTAIKTIDRPQHTFTVMNVDHANQRWRLAGKSYYTNDAVEAEFYDIITTVTPNQATPGDTNVLKNSSTIMYQWQDIIQDFGTGVQHLSAAYKCDLKVQELAPTGAILQAWIYQGAWPSDIQRNKFDYSNESDPMTITSRFTCDRILPASEYTSTIQTGDASAASGTGAGDSTSDPATP